MKLIKLSLVAALAATVTFATDFKDVGVSANVAMTSNYVWRGMTQTDDNVATQGGFDLDYKGTYIGIWGSGVNGGQEVDVYVGYANEIDKLSYDLGFIQYAYPNQVEAANFGEVYLGLGYDLEVASLSAKYSLGVETDDTIPEDYIEVAVEAPVAEGFSVAAHYGVYTNVGSDYSVGVSKSLGKIDFDLSYVGFTADDDTNSDDQDNIVLTVGTSF